MAPSVHPFIHKINNHSRAFCRLLTRVVPDWREQKQRQEGFGV
ncbi:MAG: hypothetical protein ACK5EA_28730 [Planctomycetaceae bacterium]